MDRLADSLHTVRQLHDSESGRAWRAYLLAKYEDLKDRLVFEENRDVLAAQAQILHELMSETSNIAEMRNTFGSTAQA